MAISVYWGYPTEMLARIAFWHRVFFLCSPFLLLGTAAWGNLIHPVDDYHLLGWSKDGSMIAYRRLVGMNGGAEIPSWRISTVVVSSLPFRNVIHRFKYSKYGEVPAAWVHELERYENAEPKSHWDLFNEKHVFKVPEPAVRSPDGKWSVDMLAASEVGLVTEVGPQEEYFAFGHAVSTDVFKFDIKGIGPYRSFGRWSVMYGVKGGRDGERSEFITLLDDPISSSTMTAHGKYYGQLVPYWSPDGKSVAVARTYGPIAGGGSWTDLLIGDLTKVSPDAGWPKRRLDPAKLGKYEIVEGKVADVNTLTRVVTIRSKEKNTMRFSIPLHVVIFHRGDSSWLSYLEYLRVGTRVWISYLPGSPFNEALFIRAPGGR